MKWPIRWWSSCLAAGLLVFQPNPSTGMRSTGTPAATTVAQFTSGQSARKIPFEFVGNHIYLRGQVNQSAPLWFLLDTGAAGSYLDTRHAKALGLGIQGASANTALKLPGVLLNSQSFTIQPLTFEGYDGHAVDGLLGYDFIRRFVIEIDYLRRIIQLHSPLEYRYGGSGEVIPLTMLEDDSGGKVPLVRIRILQHERDVIEGKFIADIAVRVAISFNSPFVAANNMMSATQGTIQAVLGGGAMVRESKQPVGRVPAIQLGRFTIKNSVAVFFQDKTGVLAATEFDGVIGGEFLRRFRVIFDYSRNQMILEPNRLFSDPDHYDMSGLLLVAEGTDFKRFRVSQLMENSSAATAGLVVGDIITSVNGKSASRLTLDQVRQLFKKEGRRVRLGIERGTEKLQIHLQLRKLI